MSVSGKLEVGVCIFTELGKQKAKVNRRYLASVRNCHTVEFISQGI